MGLPIVKEEEEIAIVGNSENGSTKWRSAIRHGQGRIANHPRIRKKMIERGQRIEFIPSHKIEADADDVVDQFIKRIEKRRRPKAAKAASRPQLAEAFTFHRRPK
ncbi:MAG: hypothetical protein ACREEM_00310 [Blastocatellia bacterium]